MPDLPPAPYLAALESRGLLPPDQAARIAADEAARPFSLHYELRALLYLGITLLAGGLGVLVYQNIDTIGHEVIILVVALLMAACFGYAARHRAAFTWGEAPKTSVGADYLLLLGCLLFLVLEGYVQFRYDAFGSRYGLATALPALVFVPLAYRFDHRGVLAMGLAALAAWVGVNSAPLEVFENDFGNPATRVAALGLGLALVAAGLASEYWRRKAHFAFSYLLLGCNLALLALLTTMVKASFDSQVGLCLLAAAFSVGLCVGLYWYAQRTGSYWFLVLGAGYGYFAICWALGQVLVLLPEDLWVLAAYLFVPLSVGLVVVFFVNIRKILPGSAPGPAAGAAGTPPPAAPAAPAAPADPADPTAPPVAPLR